MKVQPENIFIGATITNKDNENYLVVKVNAKTFYAGKGITLSQYNELWNARAKGVTFKRFCEMQKIKSFKYDDTFEISKEEFAKKEVISQSKNVNTNILSKSAKAVLNNLIKYNKLQLMVNLDAGGSIMRIIEMRDNDKFLLNVDSIYILYNKSLDISYKVCNVLEWGDTVTEVPWEKITPKS